MEKELLSEKIGNLAESRGIAALGFAQASEFTGYVSNIRTSLPQRLFG